MCGRNDVEFTPTFFDTKILTQLKPILPYVEEVTLMGWGEPTMHPEFENILNFLSQYENLRIYFCTNGLRLGDLTDTIFADKVDIIAVSLDGATATTNNRIRRGSDFETICNNLRRIVHRKHNEGLNYPYINFVFTAMKSNFHEIPDMVRLAADIGLDEVKVVYLTAFGDRMLCEVLYNCQDEVLNVFREAERLGEKLNIKIKLPYIQGQDPASDRFHKKCFVAWRDFFVGSDGYIRPCMSTPIKFFKFHPDKKFIEMWNDDKFIQFRRIINTHADVCKCCYQSSHTNWNRKESFIQTGEDFAPKWADEGNTL